MGLFGKFKKKKTEPQSVEVAKKAEDGGYDNLSTEEEVEDAELAKNIVEKIRDRIDEGVENAGKSLVMGRIRKTINDVHEEGRMVFLGDNKLEYTGKQGGKHNLDFGGMADVLMQAAGWDNLVRLGVMPNEVIALIEDKYKEVKK